jgi:DNA topoisomerase-3
MKSLVLAEKPSVGKDLARVLNCSKKTKGYCEGSNYVVTWALGHLVTLAEPHVYDKKLKEWRMEDLPMLPEKMKLQVIRQTSRQFQTVRNLMKRKDISELIIATDAGREGELVARWIMKLGGWGKRPFKRLWISSQTDEAIREGFANLKTGKVYNNLFNSAVCRAEADWFIGLNVTRALTCKFNASLNAGRVQTPTLSMVVDREKDIKNFTPVDYWTIAADFGDYFGTWRDKGGNGRIFDYTKARELATTIEGQTGLIEDVSVKAKAEPPLLAYDLTELQRDANRRYGFSAKKTLSVLQNLYERHKLVTYPRTDSRYITTDMIATLPRRLKSIALGQYAKLVEPLLEKKLSPGKRFVNNSKVSDHHAIIPTEQPPNLQALTGDERSIYDLIVRRFIAVLYPPYRYDQTTVVTIVNNERFFSQGKVMKDIGWRGVTTKVADDDKADDDELPEQTLSQQKKGEQKQVKSCTIDQSKTKPPARYTEATLLTAMESPGKFIEDEELRESIKAGGLGTPATRAEIIEKLLDNYYLERNGKSLVPTSKAFQLLDLVPSELKSPELTAKWELRLSNIANGQESHKAFMTDIRKNAVELVKVVRESTATYTPDNLTQTKCPMCGNYMLLVHAKKGKKLICSDRRCGYEEFERKGASEFGKRSKKEERMNKRLIKQYSDHASASTNLGDLLKAALDKDKKEK